MQLKLEKFWRKAGLGADRGAPQPSALSTFRLDGEITLGT